MTDTGTVPVPGGAVTMSWVEENEPTGAVAPPMKTAAPEAKSVPTIVTG